MNRDEVIDLLDGIEGGDQEISHSLADQALIGFLRDNGYADVADAWERVDDRCGGFWYA